MKPLEAFSRWFGSAGGVIETLLFGLIAIVLEITDPHVDPHWFWLLVIWTIYSGVTQPALAYGNEKSSRENKAILAHLVALLEHHGVEPPAPPEPETVTAPARWWRRLTYKRGFR